MNESSINFGLAISLVLTACGGAELTSEAESRTDFIVASAGSATLTFDKDWNETLSGKLVAGGDLTIAYDASRLPRCRATHNGNPGWQITAFARFQPSGATVEAGLFDHVQTPTGPDYHTWVPVGASFPVPQDAREVELWFRNRSGFDSPCEAWDSDFGRNYRFAVEQPAFASMVFQSNWQNLVTGKVARGGKLQISYAPERMQTIVQNAETNGVPYFASKYHCYGYGCCAFEYDTSVNVRFPPEGNFQRQAIGDLAASFDVPANANGVEIYFDTAVTTTTWYCGGAEGERYRQPNQDWFYDSDYGRNFHYGIQ